MAEMTREQKLDRLKKLQRLEELESQEKSSSDTTPPVSLMAKTAEIAAKAPGAYADAMHFAQKYGVSMPLAAGLAAVTGKKYSDLMGDDSRPAQILERAGYGIPKGPALVSGPKIPGTLANVHAGDVGNMVLNEATDPMTYGAGLINKLARAKDASLLARGANAIANPIEAYNTARAESLYGKAFEDVNRVAKLNQKPIMPSELLRESGFVGGPASAENKLVDIRNQAGKELGNIRRQADTRGVTGNIWTDVVPEARIEAMELRKLRNPDYDKIADAITDRANYAMDRTPPPWDVPFSSLGAEKSALDARVARGGGFGLGYEAADTTQAQEAMANAYRLAEDRALKRGAPDLAPIFQRQKQIYSSAAPVVSDKAETVAARVANRRGLLEPTQVDMMLGGSSLISGDPSGLGALAFKKGATAWMGTAGRTARGYVANKVANAGRYGLLDSTVRSAVGNPWRLQGSYDEQ